MMRSFVQKKSIFTALALLLSAGLTACGHGGAQRSPEASAAAAHSVAHRGSAKSKGAMPSARVRTESAAPEAAPGMDFAEEAAAEEAWGEDREMEPSVPRQLPQSGLLTAGLWDDNLNFDGFLRYRQQFDPQELPGLLPIPLSAHRSTSERHHHGRKSTIDISFVIDATGSMSDEIQYLQSEFLSLSREIERRFARSEQRWSLVVYRDEGDEYVVRNFDFEHNPSAFRNHLMNQSAGGGGDYPEAAHRGLQAGISDRWRPSSDTARLLFWVADAPHHAEHATAMAGALHAAYRKDIHIYPIASSGVDELTELTMRSAAQVTGGRYIFLTDDSGVGNSHKEPTIPCYHVTNLRDAIMRSVAMEMEGRYLAPRARNIVRTVGSPEGGKCAERPYGNDVDGGWGSEGWGAGGWD